MRFQFPNKIPEKNFTSLEHEGMQALAMNARKRALDCYDKVILADPSVETIDRIVAQYHAAGLAATLDCSGYWDMARHRERWDNGKDTYKNFQCAINMMRQKYKKFLKEQHQEIMIQASSPSNQRMASFVQSNPPAYDGPITEQSTLLTGGKPND